MVTSRMHVPIVALSLFLLVDRLNAFAAEALNSVPPSLARIVSGHVARNASLSSNEVVSLKLRLSKKELKTETDVLAELPPKSRFLPVSYGLIGYTLENGRPAAYTETVSVCGLSHQYDILIVEDNRTGTNLLRQWIIRDLSKLKPREPE